MLACLTMLATLLTPVNPRTTKLFQLTIAAKGEVVATPLDYGLPERIFFEIFHGYCFGDKESNGDS